MLNSLHNPLSLVGRLLMAVLFLPAGISKIAGFAGTVGYIASKGAPLHTPGYDQVDYTSDVAKVFPTNKRRWKE